MNTYGELRKHIADIRARTLEELQEICDKLGITNTGDKSALRDRIAKHTLSSSDDQPLPWVVTRPTGGTGRTAAPSAPPGPRPSGGARPAPRPHRPPPSRPAPPASRPPTPQPANRPPAVITWTCNSCRGTNPNWAQHCAHCGAPRSQAQAPTPAPPASPPAATVPTADQLRGARSGVPAAGPPVSHDEEDEDMAGKPIYAKGANDAIWVVDEITKVTRPATGAEALAIQAGKGTDLTGVLPIPQAASTSPVTQQPTTPAGQTATVTPIEEDPHPLVVDFLKVVTLGGYKTPSEKRNQPRS